MAIGDIRRTNLGVLRDRYGGWAALNVALGRSTRDATLGQVWNQSPDSKTGRPRQMGDRLAREIEARLKLAPGWMDAPQTDQGSGDHNVAPRNLLLGDIERVVQVPMLAVVASMGAGADQQDEDVITGTLQVSAEWAARELHLPASRLRGLRFITGYGDSMRPTFGSGDVLLVDTAVHEANIDGIYVLASAQQLFIKRVTRRLDGVHEVSSDNPAVRQTTVLNGDHQVDVLGRVVYVWNGRKV